MVRRTFAALSIALACLLPAVALTTWWAYAQATDTARFDRTAAPLATDDAVQRQVVDELVAVADARLDRVPSAGLPPGGQDAARARIRSAARALVRTEAYRSAWRVVQRRAHARLATRLTGDLDAPLTLGLAPLPHAPRPPPPPPPPAARPRRVAAISALQGLSAAIADPAPIEILDRSEVRRAH